MNYNILIFGVIISFCCIHAIEVLSFTARLAGLREKKTSLAYGLQNAIFMLTRFFMMALLPILGLLVDTGIDKDIYLYMIMCALLGAGVASFFIYLIKERVIWVFVKIINNIALGKNIFREFFLFFYYLFESCNIKNSKKFSLILNKSIFFGSAIVFCIYSLSVFVVFYMALFFSDYRTMISQLSGVTNAFATVLLTFVIEPKIAKSIDLNESIIESENMMLSLILGRVFGVGVLSIFIVFLIMVLI